MDNTKSSARDHELTKARLTKLMLEEVMPILAKGIKEKNDTYEVLFQTESYLAKKGFKLPKKTTISCYVEPLEHLDLTVRKPIVPIFPCDGGAWTVVTGYITEYDDFGGIWVPYFVKITVIVCL
jgi:hypothetical protein